MRFSPSSSVDMADMSELVPRRYKEILELVLIVQEIRRSIELGWCGSSADRYKGVSPIEPLASPD